MQLYVLLRGRKKFRLFPPSMAPRMYLHGKLARVHNNGRIVYSGAGAEDIQADGSSAREVRQWQARAELEAGVLEAEAAVARGEAGAAKRLARAEAALEEALDGALGSDSDDWALLRDDFEAEAEAGGVVQEDEEGKVPDHFSQVDLYLPPGEIRKMFPEFPLDQELEVDIAAGQMLYLPAGVCSVSCHYVRTAGQTPRPSSGWFHEVLSVGGKDKGGHLAFNYWFHPPDRLESFEQPYSTGFWASVFERRASRPAVDSS